jgi:hypothetical protein
MAIERINWGLINSRRSVYSYFNLMLNQFVIINSLNSALNQSRI